MALINATLALNTFEDRWCTFKDKERAATSDDTTILYSLLIGRVGWWLLHIHGIGSNAHICCIVKIIAQECGIRQEENRMCSYVIKE